MRGNPPRGQYEERLTVYYVFITRGARVDYRVAMDLSKYPFEKLFGFAAGIIPGFVALLIFQLTKPGSFGWFFTLGFLGYKTKLSIILLTAFVIGNSMTIFLGSLLGSLGGAVGAVIAQQPYRPVEANKVAPWRDPQWRFALKNYLGSQAPNDTRLLTQELLELKRKQIDLLPEGERPAALSTLALEKLNLEIDDGKWELWYTHYHSVVLSDYSKRELDWWVRKGLNFNLETAALYTLISAFVVPGIRHWWIVLPACIWALILFAEEYVGTREVLNKWLTLSRQIQYLMAQEAVKQPASHVAGHT